MRKIKIVVLIVLASITVMSCNQKVTYFKKDVNSMVNIEIPNYMSPQDLENPESSLEYGNLLKEHYLMLMIETKEEINSYDLGIELDLTTYSEVTIEGLEEITTNATSKLLNEKPKMIHGLKAYTYTFSGTPEGFDVEIFYTITIYESKTAFYTLYDWCIKGKEKKYEKVTNHILKSFKEI